MMYTVLLDLVPDLKLTFRTVTRVSCNNVKTPSIASLSWAPERIIDAAILSSNGRSNPASPHPVQGYKNKIFIVPIRRWYDQWFRTFRLARPSCTVQGALLSGQLGRRIASPNVLACALEQQFGVINAYNANNLANRGCFPEETLVCVSPRHFKLSALNVGAPASSRAAHSSLITRFMASDSL